MRTLSEKYKDYVRNDLKKNPALHEQTLYKFPNGYGASVIYGQGTYSLEVAVIWFHDDEWNITYNTPLTDDVIGYVEDLDEVLGQIKALEGGQ